jgi:hypothetical protein
MHKTNFNMLFIAGLVGVASLAGACTDDGSSNDNANVTLTFGIETGGPESGDGDGDANTTGCPPGGCLDFPEDDSSGMVPGCASGDGSCNQVDLLFVIDNSGTMAEEQANLAANFPLLIDKLQGLTDPQGNLLHPDVNIMVTTSDLGHPECTVFQHEGYEPAQGAPQQVPCINRLSDFTGLGANPPSYPEVCQNACPFPIAPADPFIHFEGPNGSITNVPGNDVKGALSCIGPQGINGCGYEAQLEGMLQALNPDATWNTGNKPFLRDGAILAIVHVTDEADCSVRAPEGYAYFTKPEFNSFWEINPATGTKTQATSAVCWNAGVDCGQPDGDGVYADCSSIDTGVLHPLTRYLAYLKDHLVAKQNKEVIMLGILGVPLVSAHNPEPPFQPIAGGVHELVYRKWIDGPYPDGDMLPGDNSTAAEMQFEFGIGPGCIGEDGMGGFTGQAIPPVRIKEVCESLNQDVGGPNEKIRCCIESICDTDFSSAINCLTGVIQTVIDPIG